MNWLKKLKGKVKFREVLKNHTTFKIGGPVEVFFQPQDLEDLKVFLVLARRHKFPVRVLGAGSNILARDSRLKGAVIKLNTLDFKKIIFGPGYVESGSAALLKDLISSCQKKGFSSLEFLAGVPGTVGGALVMNAGAQGRNISALVQCVTVIDLNGRIKTLKSAKIKFAYRRCSLDKSIVLSSRFKLFKINPQKLSKIIKDYLASRAQSQDYSRPSAGCIFRNPAQDSAGRLIDLCGLKGKRLRGARISKKHANFILNIKHARAKDVLALMALIEKKVRDRFEIKLEPEIKIW